MDFAAQLFAAVKDFGAAGALVFAILWWLERTDRKAAEAKLETNRETLLREVITEVSSAAAGLKETGLGIAEIRASLGSVAEIVRNAMRGRE